jgi:hypothetical protein
MRDHFASDILPPLKENTGLVFKNDQVKKDEMRGYVARMVRIGMHIGYWWTARRKETTGKTKT